MRIVQSFTASIYVGTKDRDTKEVFSTDLAKQWLQDYVNLVGLCVTLTPTDFIYVNGSEPGLIVGLINYPRFPSTPSLIKQQALEIAEGLQTIFRQYKVSVVFPDETVMLSKEPNE